MALTKKEIKNRHFAKIYASAAFIKCRCGCGTELKTKDLYGRDKLYVNGHNGKKYADPKQHKREWNHRNRPARRIYKQNFERARKVKLITLFGGKCQNCPIKYDGRNACIFDFHHLNPARKEFRLNLNKMGRAWKTIVKEAKKCRLLCSNCHRKEHSIEF